MNAEVICIGTELLLGEILNSNAQYLAKQLASLGISHYYQTVVGDNIERIHRALAIAAGRAQILMITGGLGPTPDDLTTAAIASFFGAPLVEHPEIWERIIALHVQSGRTPTANNRKQALLPQGAAILTNPVGTAPGMIWQPHPQLLVMTFPGVPSELYPMWQEVAAPWLRQHGYVTQTFHSRVLLYWGIAESALAEKVDAYLQLQNPTVAPYADYGQARLRITAKAATPDAALALIEPIEAEIRARTAPYCYGADRDTLASVVASALRSHGQTLAVAESCTGGWLGQMLTSVPGSSQFFTGGVIAYSNQVKQQLLSVPPSTLDLYGAVSPETACAMALGVKQLLGTDWGLAITGIAGPDGGSDTKPVGLVYGAIADPQGGTTTYEQRWSPSRDRDWIRRVSSCSVLDHLRKRFVILDEK
jgi:nicotinamide-nucleotide amidase